MSRKQGFPLFALFFAVAFFAVLAMFVAPIGSSPMGYLLVSIAISSGMIGLFVGICVGIVQYRSGYGALMGAITGVTIASLVMPAAVAGSIGHATVTSFVGGAMLISLAALNLAFRSVNKAPKFLDEDG